MVNLRHFLLTCEFKIDLFSLSASSEESVMACLVPQRFGVIKGLTMDYIIYIRLLMMVSISDVDYMDYVGQSLYLD